MQFVETYLPGAYLIVPSRSEDDRGFFARTWCRRMFAAHGLCEDWVQCSAAFNRRRGTLRGLHFQKHPHEEVKLVRCTAGAIFDVIVDLRAESPTYLHWFAAELTAENGQSLYVPEGFAHGYQTLEDDTEVLYQISKYHDAESASGLRWDDPTLSIDWPACESHTLSPRDAALPLLVSLPEKLSCRAG